MKQIIMSLMSVNLFFALNAQADQNINSELDLSLQIENLSLNAAEGVTYAHCKSISTNGYELNFSKLTSEPANSWCERGTGRFQVYRKGKAFLTTKTEWDSCSKSGTRALAEIKGYEISFRDNGGTSWLTRPNGTLIEFQCIVREPH
ncbi:MAG: hypothetical protein SGJ18_10235 [Pseudomonadota bacterium]|nr:hypothetical protein [Pseudomonadota bacterium]